MAIMDDCDFFRFLVRILRVPRPFGRIVSTGTFSEIQKSKKRFKNHKSNLFPFYSSLDSFSYIPKMGIAAIWQQMRKSLRMHS